VVERVPVAAVVTERILYLDAEGYVLPPVVSENIFDLPVLTGTLPQNLFVPGRQIGTQDVKEGLNVLITVLTIDDELSRRISEIHLEGGGNMTLYAAEYGVPILFGQGDVVPKIVKLASFWREVVSRRGAHGLQYIDLRFDDQVVVRWVDGEEGPRKAKTLLG
jgi:cell division septal protein FtsQ